MLVLTEAEVERQRKLIIASDDADLHRDIGYFIVWYSAVEMAITVLLAHAAGVSRLDTFDILCSGMDARVKIERLRKVRKKYGGIGANLDARLKYFDEKARPIRNRLAHGGAGRSERRPGVYFLSSLSTLPWQDFEMAEIVGSSPPFEISSHELISWGGWFVYFAQDLSDAANLAAQSGEYEIKNPRSPVPLAGPANQPRKAPRATTRKSRGKKPR